MKKCIVICCLFFLCGCLGRRSANTEVSTIQIASAIIVELAYPSDFSIPEVDIHLVEVNTGMEYSTISEAMYIGGWDDGDEDNEISAVPEPVNNKITIKVPAGVYVVYGYYEQRDRRKKSGYIATAVWQNPNDRNSPLALIEVKPNLQTEVVLTFMESDSDPRLSEIPPFGETFAEYRERRQKNIAQQEDNVQPEYLEAQRLSNEKIEYVNSPDYRWTAFVEWTSNADEYSMGDGYAVQSQIKLINNETEKVKVAVPFQFDTEPKKGMRGFQNIMWDLESDGFYFTTSAWAVSDAIHYYNISSGQTHYVSSGLGIEGVFSEGEYKGYLETWHTTIEEGEGRVKYKAAISPDGKTTIRLTENMPL